MFRKSQSPSEVTSERGRRGHRRGPRKLRFAMLTSEPVSTGARQGTRIWVRAWLAHRHRFSRERNDRGHMLTHPLKALALLAVFGTMSTQATSQVPSLKGAPKLSCAGGTVEGTSCVCPQGQEPIHVGAQAWRCREKKGPQLTGPPTLSCGGGTVQGTSCICPSGQEAVQVGTAAWRCAKKEDQKLAGPPTISCAGGTAKGTTCLCPRGQEAVKVGDNAWRCRQKKGPQLTTGTVSCAGGNVQGTSCVCPVGQEPVQVANHAWRCRVKKGPQLTTPTIRCEGGRVMGARCVCPAGKHAEQGVCKSDRPTTPTDGKRYKLKVISGQPGTPGSTARTVPLRVPRSQQ